MLGLSPLPAAKSIALAVAADRCGAVLPAGADPSRAFDGVATLDRAGRGDISACFDDRALDDLRATRAGACFVPAHHLPAVPDGTIALVTATPRSALRRVAALIYGTGDLARRTERAGIDPAALVHPDARLEPDVTIAAGAIVGPRAEIGAGTRVGAHVAIGADVRIGRGSHIDSHVSLNAALLGDRVVVRAGARIGETEPPSSAAPGRVILQDDVEIGANAVVARGELEDTVVGEGSRVEALAFVPAGARLDRHRLVRRGSEGLEATPPPD